MRKYGLYAAGICAAIVLGTGGCAANASGATTPTAAARETAADTTVADTIVESAGTIESMAEGQPEALQLIRIYGPVTKMEDGRLSIDNQSSVSAGGEIILNLSDTTYILNAESGLPVKPESIKDGDTIHAYIGPAMTMSLPPITNAEMILVNAAPQAEFPEYVEVKSMITDAAASQSVLTSAEGTKYILSDDCSIFPYLTKNIVTLDDLTEGRKCLVWSGDDNVAGKIMVFAQ